MSVVLKSLDVWLPAVFLFDSLLGFIKSCKISKFDRDTSTLRTLNIVRFDVLEYW